MRITLKERFKTFRAALHHAWRWINGFFILVGILDLIFARGCSEETDAKLPRLFPTLPWYLWVIIWLGLLLIMMLEYATKKRLDAEALDNEARQKKVQSDRPWDLINDFLDKKIGQLNNLQKDPALNGKKVDNWAKNLFDGVNMTYEGKLTNVDVKASLHIIAHRVEAYKAYPTMNDLGDLRKSLEEFKAVVNQIKKDIQPYEIWQNLKAPDLKITPLI